MDSNNDALFMGIDSSTQSLKVTIVDDRLNVVYDQSINFDNDIPEFKTEGGVHHDSDGLTVTSPPVMWVAALDLLVNRMKEDGAPLDRVVAVSGSGQQHGSVWMKPGSRDALMNLDPQKTLREQLENIFSVEKSPVWMDSSTTSQCRQLEDYLGGAQSVADLTGSRAYERFTGNQIAKIYQTQQSAYNNTERIALVSSFIASLMTGDYVSIDVSDGAGMNLMNLRTKQWAQNALDATAPNLADKLGEIVSSHKVVGSISKYYTDRYGFNKDCKVVAFSGDNPCSFAGLRIQRTGDLAISLGTSSTIFGSLTEPNPSGSEGHIFANPIDPDSYMAMLCYSNGSLTVESVRDSCADCSWDKFGEIMNQTSPGNAGNIGIYIREPEITPPILQTGVYRFDSEGAPVSDFSPDIEVRAVVESQFLSMRLHGERIGLRPKSILATGGASKDKAVIRVMSDVFGVPVFLAEQTDSASLGAAYRARHGWLSDEAGQFIAFADTMKDASEFTQVADPDMADHAIYTAMLADYERIEEQVIAAS